MVLTSQKDEGEGWYVEVTEQPLDLLQLTQLVTDPAAGAISTFIGTTRNSFNGKAVLHLEYEAYVPMALTKLKVRPMGPGACRVEQWLW